jgi:EAL domain-containing protein (putative c-di-GMP-specific phosphodiesterase class I)
MRVIAEAVDSQEVATLLADLGCDMIQDLHYSPALSRGDITLWCLEKKSVRYSANSYYDSLFKKKAVI